MRIITKTKNMKRLLTLILILSVFSTNAFSQEKVSIDVSSKKASGTIDPMIYGQLFEHIYFSANNGVWQELIFERSFEPEQFPGIHPRDGYFDGWYMDDDNVLHSPTRYEQPLNITSVDGDDYEITMDVKWRSYKLVNRSWSGGLMDIRFAVKNQANGEPYFVRLHDPYYETKILSTAQTESQIQAQSLAQARQNAMQVTDQNFSVSKRVEREVTMGNRTRKMVNLEPITYKIATDQQMNENQDWHKLRIVCKGTSVTVYWDGKKVLTSNKLEAAGKNDIVFWVNYTEAYYKNIKVASANGKTVYFEGTPEDVKIPAVAHQWNSFGNGKFELVKGDAINMEYSQKITATSKTGVYQGPQNVVAGETFVGSIYAKGNGTLSVGLKRGDDFIVEQKLGVPGSEWKKFDISLPAGANSGDADFAIAVENGTVQIDQVTLSTATGQANGGFRPDILQAVKDLHPTCLRWPGGGYVAQYDWKWGIGPQEDRQRWPNWMWMDYDQNCFGTDEFIKFCREVNTEPIIVVSVRFELPESERERIIQDAADWVAYCNEPATGKWGSIRAANGHPEPYNVKYWEIDNEMWEMGIEKYEACVRDFSEAMRAVDPTIKIIACGGFRGQDEGMIQRSANYFDYLSLHHYEQPGGYAAGPARLGAQYDQYAEMIANSPNPNVKLFISEWNLQSIDWRTGLFAGGFLNECEERDIVAIGSAALFIRRTDAPDWNNAFINFDYKDLFVAPNYQVTELWYNNFSRYRLDFEGDTKDLSVVTTMSEDGRDVIVKVVNATDKPYRLTVNGDWKGIASTKYEYFAPGSLDVQNSMENKNAVALKTFTPSFTEENVVLEVAPLSAGVLRIAKKF